MSDRERDDGSTPRGDETEPASDHHLLMQMRARDESALAALYDRYSGLVYTLALRVVGDRDLAEEVLQDTFWRCWQGAEQFDHARGRVAGWLMGVARNRAIDLLRSGQHRARLRERESLPESGAHGEPGHADTSDAVLLRQVVSGALEGLSTGQRQAIELAYYGGLTQAEIARELGQPLGTVKTRMRDGLGRLRQLLDPLIESPGEAVERRD